MQRLKSALGVVSSSPVSVRRASLAMAVVGTVAVAFASSVTSAAVTTWTSGTSGNWADPAKWDILPVGGDSLQFNGVAGPVITANNDFPALTQFGFFSQDTATTGTYANGRSAIAFGGPGQFILTGNTIGVVGDINNTSGLLQTINNNLIGRDVQGGNGRGFGINYNVGTGGLTINGSIGANTTGGAAPNGNGFVDFNVTGAGPLTLNGANTHAAIFSAAGSNLVLNNTNDVKFFGTMNGNITINTAGTFSALSDIRLNGNVTVNGNGLFKTTAFVAQAATTNAVYTLNDTARFQTGDLNVGDLGGAVVVMNVNNTSAVTTANTFIGRSGTGTVNMNGGTWNATGFRVGTESTGVGTLNLAAGTITATSFTSIGANNNGTIAARGRMNVTGGTFTNGTNDFNITDNANTRGVLNMTAGSVTGGQIFVGKGTGTVGLVQISGGTVTGQGNMQVGASGIGTLQMTGGTWTSTVGFPSVGRFAVGFGVMDLSGTAVFNQNGAAQRFIVGEEGSGVLSIRSGGTLNVNNTTNVNTAGSLDSDNAAFTIGNNNVAGSVGIVNLLAGGTLSARSIGSNAATALNSATLNFNGGTFRVSSARTTAGSIISDNVDNVFVYAGGATIDTNGISSVLSKALIAPTGAGVASIAATGTGYTAIPAVRISGGGGSGATAIAQIDNLGNLTGILITNPGTGYTGAPTVVITGVDGTAVVAAPVLNAGNLSGGLNKVGGGFLALNGANTYTGATSVLAGTLGGNGSVAGAVNIANGAAIDPGLASLIGTLTVGSTTLATGSALAVEVDATSSDVLAVNGLLDLSANQTLYVSPIALLAGAPYTIATYTTGLLGTFDTTNLPSGYVVVYGPAIGAGSITLVPEPATLSALAGIGMMAIARRRRA